VDITKPDEPREIGSFKTRGFARDVALWGGYAYIADDTQGICIADIAGSPYSVDSIETGGRVHGLYRVQNRLFVSDADKGLKMLDLSIPDRPLEISGVMPEGASIVQTVVSSGTAYCVNLNKGILCCDISGMSDLKLKDLNVALQISKVELQKPPSPPASSNTPSSTSRPPSNVPSPPLNTSSPRANGKVAYITIDDGSSRNNTPVILDILKEYGIKATFFVLPSDKVTDIYKRILDEGHVIGNHSYSHDYDYLYSSLDNFKKDVIKARTYIYNKLNYTSTVFRFPGGAMGKNKDMINRRADLLKELGYTWFDWNASTGDADRGVKKYGDEEDIVNLLINNVLSHTYLKKKLIVLMHDSYTKTYTVKALPKIIDGLIKQGYRFDVLTNY
jgi:peptidoglycan/xylan/chitin deacetylase (PgdA/CDA1 family)